MTAQNAQGYEDIAVRRSWPTDWPGRHAEYERRMGVYLMGEYTDAEILRLGLFQGTDSTGFRIIHRARRISRLAGFAADVDAAAISSGMTLDTRPDIGSDTQREALTTRGMETWRRSRVGAKARGWALDLSVCGNVAFEATTNEKNEPVIVCHKPQNVTWYLDPLGLAIVRAVVAFDLPQDDGTSVRYVRDLRPDTVTVTTDGKSETYPNPLGVVPLIPVEFGPGRDPYLGTCAFHGVEDGISLYDSAMTMLATIGAKNANPWVVVVGASLPSGSAATGAATEGRALSLPAGASAEYLEATLQGVTALVDQAVAAHGNAAMMTPELLFSEAGAGASGTALSHRAGAFVLKITPARDAFGEALSVSLGMAHALADKVPWTEAADVYTITRGPVLQLDRAAELDLLAKADDLGAILKGDLARGLQGLGIIPRDADADEYAAKADDEHGQREARTMDNVARLGQGRQPVEPSRVEAPHTETPGRNTPPRNDDADTER